MFKGRYYGTYKRTFTIIPEETAIDDLSKNGTVIKVSWHERNRQITGYEIRYSTDSKYETYKTKRVSKKYLSTRIKELKKNKRYYLKIRTYKTVDDRRIYSLWSETRTIK